MKTIYISEPIHPDAVALLESYGRVIYQYGDEIERVDAVVLRAEPITRGTMLRAKRLKVIGRHGVGMDNVDLPAAKELRIPVVYTPNANAASVSELVVGLSLCMARKIAETSEIMKREGFAGMGPPSMRGTEIGGKTVGLLGFGKIARLIARSMKNGFGANVVAYDPFLPNDTFAAEGVERATSLEECLEAADIVSVNMPLSGETANTISTAAFAIMKDGAILINAARGGIVDEAALYEALASGKLAGAACDVFANEPHTKGHPLLSLPNFVGLPHVGANTHEAMYRMAMTVAEDIIAILEGQPPKYLYFY